MLNTRTAVIIRTALFALSLISSTVAYYLKSYIIDHQVVWASRSDLVSIPLFAGNLLAPPNVCYFYVASCVMALVSILVVGFVRSKDR